MSKSTSKEKLKELIVYVSSKCSNDPRFGLTKLAKIICFSDMLYYANFGKSITGQEYIKKERGPLARDFYEVKDELIANKDVVSIYEQVIGYQREKLQATREPKFSLFTSQEISFIDNVIKAFEKANNKGASDFSHSFLVGWQDVEYDEEIPYQSIFLPPNYELTEADKSYSAQLIRKYEWDKAYGWATK